MARIDVTARIGSGAKIADSVEVGPFCVVGSGAELRDGVRLISHVCVNGVTVVGERTVVHPFAVLGSEPQSIGYRGEPTRLSIGADCVIRESATMCTGTVDGGGITTVGDRGYFMAYSHIGHDCRVGTDVVFANNATLGGHAVIGDYCFIGGLGAVHQYVRVGHNAMIGGLSGLTTDLIPFGIVKGDYAWLRGINIVGMRRRKFPASAIRAVRSAYQRLFHGEGTMPQRVDAVEQEFGHEPAVAEIISFIRDGRKRALCRPPNRSEAEPDDGG